MQAFCKPRAFIACATDTKGVDSSCRLWCGPAFLLMQAAGGAGAGMGMGGEGEGGVRRRKKKKMVGCSLMCACACVLASVGSMLRVVRDVCKPHVCVCVCMCISVRGQHVESRP